MNVSKVLRLSTMTTVYKVILPSSLPLIFTGLRLSLGVGWMVLIAAEMLAQKPGSRKVRMGRVSKWLFEFSGENNGGRPNDWVNWVLIRPGDVCAANAIYVFFFSIVNKLKR